MIAVNLKNIRFKPGHVMVTPGALGALECSGQSRWILPSCYLAGVWGIVDDRDKVANKEAFKDGSRLLSACLLDAGEKTKVWVLTEAEDDHGNREATTSLLPDEY